MLGQAILPGSWSSLVGAGTVWITVAFFIAATNHRAWTCIMAGIISFIGMLTGYYGYSMGILGITHSSYFIVFWTILSVIGGIIFGTAGHLWRNVQGRGHCLGSAVISSIYLADSIHTLVHFNHYQRMVYSIIVESIIGMMLILILERSARARITSLITAVPFVAFLLFAYYILYAATN